MAFCFASTAFLSDISNLIIPTSVTDITFIFDSTNILEDYYYFKYTGTVEQFELIEGIYMIEVEGDGVIVECTDGFFRSGECPHIKKCKHPNMEYDEEASYGYCADCDTEIYEKLSVCIICKEVLECNHSNLCKHPNMEFDEETSYGYCEDCDTEMSDTWPKCLECQERRSCFHEDYYWDEGEWGYICNICGELWY